MYALMWGLLTWVRIQLTQALVLPMTVDLVFSVIVGKSYHLPRTKYIFE